MLTNNQGDTTKLEQSKHRRLEHVDPKRTLPDKLWLRATRENLLDNFTHALHPKHKADFARNILNGPP